jgi:uncharacterized protein
MAMIKPVRFTLDFLLFLASGFLVFVVFSHIRPLLPSGLDLPCRIAAAAIFLAAALLARPGKPSEPYGKVFMAFFIASAALLLDFYLPTREWLLGALRLENMSVPGIALEKLDTGLVITATVLLLNRLSGQKLPDLYLRQGHPRQSLVIGSISFIIVAAGSFFIAQLFGARDLTLARIGPWVPWILIFIFANAFCEELVFRGLFLQKMSGFLGRFAANLVIAIPFVLHHVGVTYTNDALLFLVYLLPLSLAWGWITQKTGSIWGAVLFHAATDIPVVLVLFSRI